MKNNKVIFLFTGGGILVLAAYFSITISPKNTIQPEIIPVLQKSSPLANLEEPFSYSSSTYKIGWETYINRNDGYSLKYPSDWSIRAGTNGVVLNSPENQASQARQKMDDIHVDIHANIFSFSQYGGPTYNSVEDMIGKMEDAKKKDMYSTPKYSEMKPILFAGQKAYEGLLAGYDAYYVILAEKNSRIYEISFGNKQTRESLSGTEKKILASFQYTK